MKVVLQDGNKDCGVCCLLSIIRFFGGDVSKEYLREITNTTRNGVTAYNLIKGSKKLGFSAEGVSGDMTKIEKNNLPCLAHLSVNKNYKHFVVIYNIDFNNKKVIIMDPAIGRRVLSFSEFKLLSTGNYIFLKPIKKIPFLVNKKTIRRMIFNYLGKNKNSLILLIILALCYFIFNVLVAFHFKYLLYFVVNYNIVVNLKIISAIILFLYLFKALNGILKNILFVKISNFIDQSITIKTFEQILLLPYLYYKNRTTGEVVTRLKDLNNLKSYLIKLFNVLVTDLFSFFLFLVFLCMINLYMTIIAVSLMFFLVIYIVIRNKRKRKLYSSVCLKEEVVNSYLIEALSNVDTIKGGHIEKRLSDKFLYKYRGLLDVSYLYVLFLEINQFVRDNVKDLMLVIVYSLGCFLVVNKKLEVGDIFLFQTFLMYFVNSCMSIIGLIDDYYNYKISLDRVEDLYTINRENFSNSYYYYNYKLDGDILFNNLTYKYGSKIILDDISFKICSGEKILLLGESGTGKSSLMKILMRYLEVDFGMCSISGIDINHYHLENIRKNISYVSSNEFLFTDSLYNNITLEREVSDEVFSKLAEITKVLDIVLKRDGGYQILVEENGFNFSNGERQRIILFRYLLKNSSIYIFDEALGQIDISMEKEILENMFDYLSCKTVIVISHRMNNFSLYDKVVRLRDGKLYEENV